MELYEVFVSPHGRHGNDGSRKQPYPNLKWALSSAASRRTRHIVPITLLGGDYTIERTVEIGEYASKIVIRPAPGETVRLIGGRAVRGWKRVNDPAVLERLDEVARPHVMETDLRLQGVSDFGRLRPRGFGREMMQPAHLELFFNRRPMTLARWPNECFATIDKVAAVDKENWFADGSATGWFGYTGDRPRNWTNAKDAWVHGYWRWDWADSYESVERIDAEQRRIHTRPPHGIYGYWEGQRWRALNLLEELDQPGEYYLDRRTGVLYFWPPESPEPIGESETIVSVLESPLIRLRGATNVTIEGLTLECTRGNAIEIHGGSGCRVRGCSIRNIGNCAVVVEGGTDHGVESCDIADCGDAGVILRGGDRATLAPGNHFADGNTITRVGRWCPCYRAGVQVSGVGHRVSRNHIYDLPHNAILLTGNEHVIEFNDVHHACLTTGDVGAFYMGRDFTERGVIVRNNYFHHLGGMGLGSMAVYLDDGASGVRVENNVFYKTQRAAFIGGGRDNRVEGNIFVDCQPAVQIDGRGIDPNPVWQNMVNQTMRERLLAMKHHEPPYRERYPELAALDRYLEAGKGVPPEGNVVASNICLGGEWLTIHWLATPEMVEVGDNVVGDPSVFASPTDPAAAGFRLTEDAAKRLGRPADPLAGVGPGGGDSGA